MSELKSIVQNYYDAWRLEDKSLLSLSHDLTHTSPGTNFKSKKEFLDTCWGKFPPNKIEIIEMLEERNLVAVLFRVDPEAKLFSEWFTIENSLITKIRVVY